MFNIQLDPKAACSICTKSNRCSRIAPTFSLFLSSSRQESLQQRSHDDAPQDIDTRSTSSVRMQYLSTVLLPQGQADLAHGLPSGFRYVSLLFLFARLQVSHADAATLETRVRLQQRSLTVDAIQRPPLCSCRHPNSSDGSHWNETLNQCQVKKPTESQANLPAAFDADRLATSSVKRSLSTAVPMSDMKRAASN